MGKLAKTATRNNGSNPSVKDQDNRGKYKDGIGQYLPPKPWDHIVIPTMFRQELSVRIVGISPLITKCLKGRDIRKAGPDSKVLTEEEKYLLCFYMMPSSPAGPGEPRAKYGGPASGLGRLLRKSFQFAFGENNLDIKKANRMAATCFVIPDETGNYHDQLRRGSGGEEEEEEVVEGINGLINLHYSSMKKVKDNARNPNAFGTPITVVRPYFFDWWMDLRIQYDPNCVAEKHILRALTWGGYYLGYCERRPEKCGEQYGQFTVRPDDPITVKRKPVPAS